MKEESKQYLIQEWGESAHTVITACAATNKNPMTFSEFLNHCTACGGNWGGMLLSGIKKLFPNVYDAIPDHMGKHAFFCLAEVLLLCGIDTAQ